MTSFNDFGLAEPITRALAEEKYVTPTPIQIDAIPLVLAGRDVVGIAQTGTGKTAAFALADPQPARRQPEAAGEERPAACSCSARRASCPGRSSTASAPTAATCASSPRSSSAACRWARQVRDLLNGLDVLVATPGRLLDLMKQNGVRLNQVEVLVLDEADRMLDMGFIHDIRKIIAKLPKERQTLLFSATMPREIADLAAHMLRDPARVAVTPVASTVERVDQRIILTDRSSKPALLAELLKSEPVERALVFTRTKHGADKVVRGLHKAGFSAEAIHGNKSQNQRPMASARPPGQEEADPAGPRAGEQRRHRRAAARRAPRR